MAEGAEGEEQVVKEALEEVPEEVTGEAVKKAAELLRAAAPRSFSGAARSREKLLRALNSLSHALVVCDRARSGESRTAILRALSDLLELRPDDFRCLAKSVGDFRDIISDGVTSRDRTMLRDVVTVVMTSSVPTDIWALLM